MSDVFLKDLEHVLNANSMERGSNTPDYILAEFLTRCLDAFNRGVVDREAWHVAVRKDAALGAFVREQMRLSDAVIRVEGTGVNSELVSAFRAFIAEQEKQG